MVKSVVIVGGGVAGATLAKTLQLHANVTLIDPKEYFEIPWASLRAMVEPSFAERIVINHRDYFTKGGLVISSAVNFTETQVITADGRHIPYDYLVLATGHTQPAVPVTRVERLNQYKAENQKIKSARSILIVGGGPTGVELAGEIAVDFPEKKVTLVHKGSRLLEFIGTKASRKTMKWLKSKKVEVKLEQSVNLNSVEDTPNRTYRTSLGDTIEADCHFLCTGKPLSSAWLRETLIKNDLNVDGRIKVDESLRVKGRTNIFAIGDITDVPEIKQGMYAQGQAQVVAKNLRLLIDGGKKRKLASYKAQAEVAIVSLGRRQGVAQFPFMTVLGRFPGMIKSGDLFVAKTRKDLGLQPNVKEA
ncbi:uncharacterized protein LOC129313601 [Prosopis cineraria]|uniref:uncharacterized protein LOC129313601 n=1 Tax=Prosopis cineraria TaxID=364024 RepID=UPI00240F804B|nr:uncharacterized protein LOC129313601 [Prosopis cineraria]